MFEGTFIYFFLLFVLYLVIYITVRICIGSLLKRAKEKAWKAYIPFYTVYFLVDMLSLKKSVFYMTFIPVANLYYYNIIIKKLLENFGQDSKDSVLYLIIPLYKFPELVFKKPKYLANEYDLTEGFVEAENILFNKDNKDNKENEQPLMTSFTDDFNQINNISEVNSEVPNNFNQINDVHDINQNNTPVSNDYNQINNISEVNSTVPNNFNQINDVHDINQNNTPVSNDYNQINNISEVNSTVPNNFNQINDVHDINQNNTPVSNDYNQINNISEVNSTVPNNFNQINDVHDINQNNVIDNTQSTLYNSNQSLFNSRNAEVTDSDLNVNARKITHETYVEAEPKEEEKEKPAIVPFAEGRPKFCPNCGARLSSSATTCFLCGHSL